MRLDLRAVHKHSSGATDGSIIIEPILAWLINSQRPTQSTNPVDLPFAELV